MNEINEEGKNVNEHLQEQRDYLHEKIQYGMQKTDDKLHAEMVALHFDSWMKRVYSCG